MKLLIVDDQPSVVDGLIRGIKWRKLGFTRVLTASYAFEARAILKDNIVDVMLCDIEMPMENGLELFSWMRQQNMETRCIFLTAHEKFSYAQEALKLGGFDYIVQPAPYSEIRQVVQRAVDDVKNSAEKDKLYTMGEVFRQQEPSIKANVLSNFLRGSQNESDVEALEYLGSLPKRNQQGYLVLLQILRWQTAIHKWERNLLATALENLCKDIFFTYNQLSIVADMSDNTFSLVLQSKNEGEELKPDEINRQLLFLSSICEQYIKCSIACYLDGPLPMKDMVASWTRLEELSSDNVALKKGIFQLSKLKKEPYAFRVPQIKRWYNLLCDGYNEAMEEEANQLLDQLIVSDKMNAKTLNYFYQDFLQMLYNTIEGSENVMHELFYSPEELELYRNGMRSVDQMRQLVHHVALHYKKSTQMMSQEDLVKQAIQYINEHLESEIRRDELADYVHLNADYLTRIFKKETGYTIKEYVILQKMQEARSLLRTTTLPVSFIAAKVGYSNFSHFSFTYKKIMGTTPLEERQGTIENN